MNTKCNYITFFNEFNPRIEKKLYLIPVYNGYFFSNNYCEHLQRTIEKFRYDLLYDLPFKEKGDKEVFLLNLYKELCTKQNSLHRLTKKKVSEIVDKKRNPLIKINIPLINRNSKRRLTYMHYKQLRTLTYAILTIEQVSQHFGFKINTRKKDKSISKEIIWKGGKTGIIQLLKSLIKSEVIHTGNLSENETVKLIASYFNISINRNNLSSLSRAVHSSNYDYEPEIFKQITSGYDLLIQEKREKLENQR